MASKKKMADFKKKYGPEIKGKQAAPKAKGQKSPKGKY